MGITIHYRGRLNDIGRLGALCEELAESKELSSSPLGDLSRLSADEIAERIEQWFLHEHDSDAQCDMQ